MSELIVNSSLGDYPIRIELGSAEVAAEAAVVLIDPVVEHSLAVNPSKIVRVPGSEESKTLAYCELVLVAMKQAGLTRGQLVAAVGGGAVQDVATLTSSLYMRGVPWVYVPTTLMAMVDSCIGGKSAINAGGVKNLVGNFYPPTRVIVDPRFTKTLSAEAVASGLAEAVKICFARGPESFEGFLEQDGTRHPGANDDTVSLITHVLEAKKWFVEIDEFDKAERQLLNFGHSFGHALEAACGFRIQHGIGVAVGMMAALRHPASARTEHTQLLDDFCIDLLSPVRDELRTAAAATDFEEFRSALASDKKNSAKVLRLVLPVEAGGVAIQEFESGAQELTVAERALRTALEEVTS